MPPERSLLVPCVRMLDQQRNCIIYRLLYYFGYTNHNSQINHRSHFFSAASSARPTPALNDAFHQKEGKDEEEEER